MAYLLQHMDSMVVRLRAFGLFVACATLLMSLPALAQERDAIAIESDIAAKATELDRLESQLRSNSAEIVAIGELKVLEGNLRAELDRLAAERRGYEAEKAQAHFDSGKAEANSKIASVDRRIVLLRDLKVERQMPVRDAVPLYNEGRVIIFEMDDRSQRILDQAVAIAVQQGDAAIANHRTQIMVVMHRVPNGSVQFGEQELRSYDEIETILNRATAIEAQMASDNERLSGEIEAARHSLEALRAERAALQASQEGPVDLFDSDTLEAEDFQSFDDFIKEQERLEQEAAGQRAAPVPLSPNALKGPWRLASGLAAIEFKESTSSGGEVMLEALLVTEMMEDYDAGKPLDRLLFRRVLRVDTDQSAGSFPQLFIGEVWLKENRETGFWYPVRIVMRGYDRFEMTEVDGSAQMTFVRVR